MPFSTTVTLALGSSRMIRAATLGPAATPPTMTTLFAANSVALGRPLPTEAEMGAEGGSSDMGNISQVVPSIHPMLAIDSGEAVNHQKEFAAATVTDSGDQAIRDGALAMAYTIIDMAEQDVWDRL